MDPEGTITAGNAPGVNDGASCVIVCSEEFAKRRGLEPLATVVAQGYVADEFAWLARTPANAGAQALQKAGKTIGDVKRVEVNEAFSSVALNSVAMLGADPDTANVNGGAVALGHPIGASGGRILGTMVHELRRYGRRARARGDLLGRRAGRRAPDRGLGTSQLALRRIRRMKTLLVFLIVLAAAPAALADGGPQYAVQGGMGITTPNGDRYVALAIPGGKTMLAFVNTDGSVWNGPIFRGSWGIPMVTYRDAGGLSLDGRLLVLQSTTVGPSTSFLVLDYARLPRARTGSRSAARIRSMLFLPTRRGST